MPDSLAWVESAGELGELLRRASAEQRRVRPQGSGSRSAAFAAFPAALAASVTKMNRVLEYEPADLVLSVEAGATMRQVREAAAANHQQLALDAATSESATIGATVALNAAGPLRYRYGTPRDQVLGLQLVTGDGRVVNLGGKVVKNVAGYDLTRVVVGSRGALGVIARVHIRLYPLPEQDSTFLLDSTVARILESVQAVKAAHFEPAALELYSAGSRAQLAVRVQGNSEQVHAARHALQELNVDVREFAGDAAYALWADAARRELDVPLLLRLAALPAALAATLQHAHELGQALRGPLLIAAHAGSGIVRLGGWVADAQRLWERAFDVRGALEAEGGTLRVERAPVGLPESEPLPVVREILDNLKRVFDPAGILPAHWQNGHD